MWAVRLSPASGTYFLGKGDKYVIGKVDAMPSCVGDAMPSVVGCCVLEFLFGRCFAFLNVLSYFFGQCVDTGHAVECRACVALPVKLCTFG